MAIGRHRRVLRSLVAATALATFMTGTANAVLLVADDFEAGSGTTFDPGTSRDCTRGHQSQCSVRIDPFCCSQRVRATTQVGKAITSKTTVSFMFMAASTGGNVDSYVQVQTNAGVVILDTTEGFNNGLSLTVENVGQRRGFAYWNATNAWLPISLAFDPATHKVTANGAGGSWTMDMPPGANRIERVEFWGVRWGSGTGFWYDALKVEDAGPPPNSAPAVDADLTLPVDGATLPYGGPHEFRIRAIDADGDDYFVRLDFYTAGTTTLRQSVGTDPVPSGQTTTTTLQTPLPPGDYDWTATVVDVRGARVTTQSRTFHVAHLKFLDGRYVALGDSYASGEGAPERVGLINVFEPGTDVANTNECHRSRYAYPRLIGDTPEVPRGRPMVFGACSGAVTKNLMSERQWPDEPPQFDRITDDTTLVTMSIGGNDADFGPILKDCLARGTFTANDCWEDAEPKLARRLARLDAEPGAPADPDLLGVRPLSEVYQVLRSRAVNASKIVIVGYPKFFPPNGYVNSWGLTARCENVRYNDQLWMNEAVERLNDVVQRRAEERGFIYADVEDAFLNHHLCDDDPWMNGTGFSDYHYWFHPNEKGHSMEAFLVLNAITNGEQESFRITPNGIVRVSRIVGGGRKSMTASSKWEGSDVVLTLRSPSGRVIDRSTAAPDVARQTGPTYEVVTVTDPEPGEWTIELFGADVPASGEDVSLTFGTQEAPNAPPVAAVSYQLAGATGVSVDGGASHDPDGSIAGYEWHWGDGTVTTGATATHKYAAPGTYDVTLVVRDDDGAMSFASTGAVEITGYTFAGFGSPVNAAPILNRVNAGRTIPLKWRITDAAGSPIADLGSFVQVTSAQVPCDADAPIDLVEDVATTNSGLHYEGDGNWQYNWTTEKAWAGTCRRMTLRLDDGGTADRSAMFDFR